MKKLLKQRIKGAIQDLHDFHQNTFEYEDSDNYRDQEELTGENIYNYTYDIEMTKQEDACYIVGKIEAYKDAQEELEGISKAYEVLREETFKILNSQKIGIKKSYSLQNALTSLDKLIRE